MTLDAWLVTDVGVVREHNEDSAFMEPAHGFFIVADGMGGHAAGEVASAMAVETVKKTLEDAKAEIDAFKRAPTDAGRRALVQLLQNAVLQAHQAVYQRGQTEPDKAGMGTTLDVVLVAGPEAFVAHVGDSRTYLIRDGRTSQITTDHTVAEVLVIEGKLTIEEAQVSPLRTILVNAIGVSADVGVEMAHVTLKRGDRLLLCSDGLHDYFPVEEEIAQRLSARQARRGARRRWSSSRRRAAATTTSPASRSRSSRSSRAVPPETRRANRPQPVEAPSNPFVADEPTETAFLPNTPLPTSASTVTRATEKSLRQTQPMRVSDLAEDKTKRDMESATTLPPAVAAKKAPEDEGRRQAGRGRRQDRQERRHAVGGHRDGRHRPDRGRRRSRPRRRRPTRPTPTKPARPSGGSTRVSSRRSSTRSPAGRVDRRARRRDARARTRGCASLRWRRSRRSGTRPGVAAADDLELALRGRAAR